MELNEELRAVEDGLQGEDRRRAQKHADPPGRGDARHFAIEDPAV